MKPERWAQIEEIFQAVLDCPPVKRASFLKEKCGEDTELCLEIEVLLNHHRTEGEFLESPVWDDSQFLESTLKQDIASSLKREINDSDESLIGQTIGAYRLKKELGRGGMGVVYLADRADDFQQKVAVKIVKRGIDTDFVLRRFRQERQVLAALSHPNIARLIDGGTTEDGRPFLVMEYIEGLPIDQFCDEHKLTIQARLKLFREVCSAVSYSHQRLIVHRDIKPSNILVTAEGTPKLLDFGIAKLLDQSLVSASYQPTAAAARMLTPDYASPEQLRGEETTTVSDVYSLGVLLYFLLTGFLPFQYSSNQLDKFARLVSEQNPEYPSALMINAGKTTAKKSDVNSNEQSLIEVAGKRSTEPARLRRYLADDLDNIVLKALRKEIERRYSSVEQLSEDIGRHLGGLPVKARGNDITYKTRKFMQRHKTGVLAAALLLLILVGGVAATSWQANIARQERLRAEAETEKARRRFEDSRRLSHSLMFELHDAIRDLPGATAARELLAKKTLEQLDRLVVDSDNDPTLQSELAIAYINLGNIQGNPYYPNLGNTTGALESYRKAERLTEALSKANPTDAKLRRRFWLTQLRIGDMQTTMGDLSEAALSYFHARSIIEDLVANNPDDESLRADLASSYDRQGNMLMRSSSFQEALEVYDKAVGIFEEAAAEHPGNDSMLRSVAAGHGKVGGAYLKLGKLEEAIKSYRKLLEINESRLAKNPTNAVTLDDVGGSWRVFGDAQTAANDFHGAFESYRKQLQIYQQLAAADSANVKNSVELAISYQRFGYLQARRGAPRNGIENYQKSLDILRDLESKNLSNAFIANQLALVCYYLGDANFTLASEKSSASVRAQYWSKALSLFEQSQMIYSKLPQYSFSLPADIQKISDIQSKIDDCNFFLDK
jgi:non-specific serine/threonine protein kinase/serine/threonine-protein kinase